MQDSKQQPAQNASVKVAELKPAEADRETGNAAFKKGDLQKESHPSADYMLCTCGLATIAAGVAIARMHRFRVTCKGHEKDGIS